MLTLPDSWVWDFWVADDGERYHLFFLYASRALHDPDARHDRASIGHAVSDDLVSWERVADALVRGAAGSWDDLATWTGSVLRHPDGTWFLFYTGATLTEGRNVQRIGYATSRDLTTWQKAEANPVLEADGRWYEKLGEGRWSDEAFRDPWVFPDPAGDGWHMLLTARDPRGAADDCGVVGHARSADLRTWTLEPPLSEAGAGFGQLEVIQSVLVDGQHVLLFSCLRDAVSDARRATGTTGGTWVASGSSLLGPWDVAGAQQLTSSDLYAGRLVRRRSDGAWVLLAFRHDGPDGAFVGAISDPLAVEVRDGRLRLVSER